MKTLNIKDINLTDSFFHFTLRENLEGVQTHGLLPNIGEASQVVNEQKPRVYISKGGKGALEIKNSFIHKMKELRVCDIPLEYRKFFSIKDFLSNEQIPEEKVYEAMKKRFRDEIYFKVDAIEGEDFLPEDFLPEELVSEIRTSKGFRDIKCKENHCIDVRKLNLLTSDRGSTALDIIGYLYNRLLENAREKGCEDSIKKALSDLDGLFEYIKQRELEVKQITPAAAAKNALIRTSTPIVNEAIGIELALNPEYINENKGETIYYD